MSENDNATIKDIPQQRPKDVILQDLASTEKRMEKLMDDHEPTFAKLNDLPYEDAALLQRYVNYKMDGKLDNPDWDTDFPAHLQQYIPKLNTYAKEAKVIEEKRTELEQEITPYAKKEFENKLDDLSSRIDYDKIFDYFREIDSGEREMIGNRDLLENTTTELFHLREYQHNLLSPTSEQSTFSYFDRGILFLEYSQAEWGKRGFLLDKPRENYAPSSNFENLDKSTALQQETATEVKKAVEQLHKYRELLLNYHFSLNTNAGRDHALENVLHFLNQKYESGSDFMYYTRGYDTIGYDPEMIAAAKRHADKVITEHMRAGHIAKDQITRDEDRARIDALDISQAFTDINFDGFDTPSDQIAVITPEELKTIIAENIPPDCAKDLRRIGHKLDRPKLSEGYEAVGMFFPIYGEGDNWGEVKASEIEVYKDTNLPDGSTDHEIYYTKKEFINTTFHEFGHNAHHRLDYDDMTGWETIINTDRTAVTENVKHSRSQNTRRGAQEDFSDSFKLYLQNPLLLYTLSKDRYMYMYEFFDKYLHKDQKDKFRKNIIDKMMIAATNWQRMGYSEEDIKEIYLGHEKD